MKTLFIILSSGGGGELIFIGALTGLAMWGYISLESKMRAKRQQAKAEKAKSLLDQRLISKQEFFSRCNIFLLLNDLLNYLGTKLQIKDIAEYRDKATGSSESFSISVCVEGDTCDTIKVSVSNRANSNKMEWEFSFNDSQQRMIDIIDADLIAKQIIP